MARTISVGKSAGVIGSRVSFGTSMFAIDSLEKVDLSTRCSNILELLYSLRKMTKVLGFFRVDRVKANITRFPVGTP